jgi:hypothetical protein
MDSVRPCPAYVGLDVDEISRRAVQARVLLDELGLRRLNRRSMASGYLLAQ